MLMNEAKYKDLRPSSILLDPLPNEIQPSNRRSSLFLRTTVLSEKGEEDRGKEASPSQPAVVTVRSMAQPHFRRVHGPNLTAPSKILPQQHTNELGVQ